MEAEDLDLLDRWEAGDRGAGDVLFKRYFPAVYRFFEFKTEGEVDDLVQETFLQCLKSRETFQRKSSFRTYLFAIARHVLYSYWRKRTSERPTLDIEEQSIASLSTSAGSRIARSEDLTRLLSVMRTLPLEQQLLLELFYWEDLKREELGEVFDVQTATIGSRLTRARQALHDALRTAGAAPAEPGLDDWARSLAPRE